MNYKILWGVVFLIIIGAGVFFLDGSKSQGKSVLNTGEVQLVTLSEKNMNYYPNTINVKVGQPVSITLDSSVAGCLRSFNIKDLGVKGYSQNPGQTIDFTPSKKGTYRFACSMGMGYGNIIVE
ncbi:MAG: cupredoxin domain-containing protein [Nanoarchaeota archaeon]